MVEKKNKAAKFKREWPGELMINGIETWWTKKQTKYVNRKNKGSKEINDSGRQQLQKNLVFGAYHPSNGRFLKTVEEKSNMAYRPQM